MGEKCGLVHGVGRNDANYQVHVNKMIGGRKKTIWQCRFYQAWRDMLKRCYSSKYHDRRPTYKGCSVTPEWHSFSAFKAWMAAQDHEGKDLDKDILINGNKVYSPDACAFVSRGLNTFISEGGSARGQWPIGVCLDKHTGRFRAQCNNPFTGKRAHLGYFTSQESAHEAWRARKHQHALAYADIQGDRRISVVLRCKYSKDQD